MGIISVAACATGLVLIAIFSFKLRGLAKDYESDEAERGALMWLWRACLIVILLSAFGIIDTYIYKLPNPFRGPTVGSELPQSSPPPPTPVRPDVRADDLRPDVKDLRKEHREQLDEFEHGPPPPERPTQ